MPLRSIRASNFRSFKTLDIDLTPLNVVVGANASGKSNFIQIFRFLRDLAESGVENAVSLQGGAEYLRNVQAPKTAPIFIELVDRPTNSVDMFQPGLDEHSFKIVKSTYTCTVDLGSDDRTPYIPGEQLLLDLQISREGEKGEGSGQIVIEKGERKYDATFSGEAQLVPAVISATRNLLDFFLTPKSQSNSFLQQTILVPFLKILDVPTAQTVFNIAVFDINPKEPKSATLIGGKTELESDANNLAIVLNKILRNPESKRLFLNILRDLLPFVSDVAPERYSDGSMFFQIAESYSPYVRFPAHLISDGTVNLVAMIVALFFEEKSLIVIEEPERNIHPTLISKLMAMMKDASRTKQIVATTHSPEVVRNTDPNDLLLVSRDKNGFSRIARPSNDEEIQNFLAQDIGMGDLYIQDLLSLRQ